jgi:antitoxin MazE
MRATVIPIGDDKGIRIPDELLEECGIGDSVDIRVDSGRLVIAPASAPREGWSEAFAGVDDDDMLLDPPVATNWDETEWEW